MESKKIFNVVFEYIDCYHSDWPWGQKFMAALEITARVMEPIEIIDFEMEDECRSLLFAAEKKMEPGKEK